ncbi:MAG: uracil-DNA glycosylase [candidate division Zixibacteria bacterium]|nr:uracil-DNA glycosylase [candidate division Zixibacteria bacterium]
MKDLPVNLKDMFCRALKANVELGVGEIIVANHTQEENETISSMSSSRKIKEEAAVSDLFESPEPVLRTSSFDSPDSHRASICECRECPLWQGRNKFVYGAGNPEADLMFIGEAPGADEDRLGEPFVGRAGQLLDRILAAIDLSRKEVYIANILKCRPPGNRDPRPEEMEQCFPHLREQVAIIRPRLICALGRIAAQALLKTTTPLGRLREQWHQYEGVTMIVTYHPAALLRFQAYKKDTWADMQMLKTRYDELTG